MSKLTLIIGKHKQAYEQLIKITRDSVYEKLLKEVNTHYKHYIGKKILYNNSKMIVNGIRAVKSTDKIELRVLADCMKLTTKGEPYKRGGEVIIDLIRLEKTNGTIKLLK